MHPLQCPLCTCADQEQLVYYEDRDIKYPYDKGHNLHVFQCKKCNACVTREGGSTYRFLNDLAYSVPPRESPWKDYEFN